MKRSALAIAAIIAAALLVAACGGGSSGSGSSSTAPGGGASGGVTAKKATAPNAPVGSKVVACSEGAEEIVQLRATVVGCDAARTTMRHWAQSHGCTLGKSGGPSSCALGGFRCQAVRVDRGAAVSCARPDGDVSFVAKAWLLRKAAAG